MENDKLFDSQIQRNEICGKFSEEELQELAKIKAPISANEFERIKALRESKALDLDDLDTRFMRLVDLAAKVFKVLSIVPLI